MLNKLKTTLIAGAVSTLALLPLGGVADQLTDILEKGTITIGVPENFPPFGSVGADFEHEGYDVDIAKLIAEDLGVELELKPITSKQRIPFLTSGTVDLVVSSMGANPERAKSVWFSSAYAPFFSGAFAAPGVTGGTIEDLELFKALPEGAELIRFGDNAATLSAYLAGQVDVLVTGNTVATGLVAENPDKALETKFIVRRSPASIGVKSGESNMQQWVNVFVLHKKLGGVLNELSVKWLGQELPDLPSL
ncbi:transporter substrate-binding domain-containing protein [Epibacterium ulvae]|uniref:transporter substrate-binding domain-containing protein n=1 Tax=Epibacterium ulvae TaxID=1156985 RepID=UPI001BFCD3F9|nr:transporter substrate-binding domain-containing protein [Epibacterium ulvae]MBT8155455.1 transporter substrate-binding domain-containing protein [Epibacterium ulvae]